MIVVAASRFVRNVAAFLLLTPLSDCSDCSDNVIQLRTGKQLKFPKVVRNPKINSTPLGDRVDFSKDSGRARRALYGKKAIAKQKFDLAYIANNCQLKYLVAERHCVRLIVATQTKLL